MDLKPLSVAAGLLGLVFVGYCLYFDRKRRSEPDFKRKLQERRKSSKKETQEEEIKTPDCTNPEEVQKFLDYQILLAERLLNDGKVDDGLQHICIALSYCQQPTRLMQALQHVLPQPIFIALLKKLQPINSIRNLVEDNVD